MEDIQPLAAKANASAAKGTTTASLAPVVSVDADSDLIVLKPGQAAPAGERRCCTRRRIIAGGCFGGVLLALGVVAAVFVPALLALKDLSLASVDGLSATELPGGALLRVTGVTASFPGSTAPFHIEVCDVGVQVGHIATLRHLQASTAAALAAAGGKASAASLLAPANAAPACFPLSSASPSADVAWSAEWLEDADSTLAHLSAAASTGLAISATTTVHVKLGGMTLLTLAPSFDFDATAALASALSSAAASFSTLQAQGAEAVAGAVASGARRLQAQPPTAADAALAKRWSRVDFDVQAALAGAALPVKRIELLHSGAAFRVELQTDAAAASPAAAVSAVVAAAVLPPTHIVVTADSASAAPSVLTLWHSVDFAAAKAPVLNAAVAAARRVAPQMLRSLLPSAEALADMTDGLLSTNGTFAATPPPLTAGEALASDVTFNVVSVPLWVATPASATFGRWPALAQASQSVAASYVASLRKDAADWRSNPWARLSLVSTVAVEQTASETTAAASASACPSSNMLMAVAAAAITAAVPGQATRPSLAAGAGGNECNSNGVLRVPLLSLGVGVLAGQSLQQALQATRSASAGASGGASAGRRLSGVVARSGILGAASVGITISMYPTPRAFQSALTTVVAGGLTLSVAAVTRLAQDGALATPPLVDALLPLVADYLNGMQYKAVTTALAVETHIPSVFIPVSLPSRLPSQADRAAFSAQRIMSSWVDLSAAGCHGPYVPSYGCVSEALRRPGSLVKRTPCGAVTATAYAAGVDSTGAYVYGDVAYSVVSFASVTLDVDAKNLPACVRHLAAEYQVLDLLGAARSLADQDAKELGLPPPADAAGPFPAWMFVNRRNEQLDTASRSAGGTVELALEDVGRVALPLSLGARDWLIPVPDGPQNAFGPYMWVLPRGGLAVEHTNYRDARLQYQVYPSAAVLSDHDVTPASVQRTVVIGAGNDSTTSTFMTTAAVPFGVSVASAYLPVVRALSLGASAVVAESAALNGASWGSPAPAHAGSVLACFSADSAERAASCPAAAAAYVSSSSPVLGTGGWVLSGPCDPHQLPSDITPEGVPQQGCVGVIARVESSLLSGTFGAAGRIDAAEGNGVAGTFTFGTSELLAPGSLAGLSGIASARVQQREQGLQLSLRIPSLQVSIGAGLGERVARLVQLQTVDCCDGDYLAEGLAEEGTASLLAPATFAVDGMQPMSMAIAEHGPALLDILARLGRKLPAALVAWISPPLADAVDAGTQALLAARVLTADAAPPTAGGAARLMRGSAAAAVARKLQEAEEVVARASVSTDDVAAALSSSPIFAAIDGLREALREAAAGITGTASRALAPAVQLLPEELRGPAQAAVDAVGSAGATAVDAVAGELVRALEDSEVAEATLDYSQRCQGTCAAEWLTWALVQARAARLNGSWAVQAALPANGPDGWRLAAKQAALDATAPGHRMQARMFVLYLALRGAGGATRLELDVGTALGQTDALLATLLRVFSAGSGLDVDGTYPLAELATAGLHGVLAAADALTGGSAPPAPPPQPAAPSASASASVSPSVSPAASAASAAAVRAAFQVAAVPLSSVNSTSFVAAVEASLQHALAAAAPSTASGAAAPVPVVYEIDDARTGAVLYRLEAAAELLAMYAGRRRLQAASGGATGSDATGSINIKVIILTDSSAGAASVLTTLTGDAAALAGNFTAALQAADAAVFANATTSYTEGSATVTYALPTPSVSVSPSMTAEPSPAGPEAPPEASTPSTSPSVSAEASPASVPSESASPTPSASETASESPSASETASESPSASSEASVSATLSASASSEASVSATMSTSGSETASASESPSSEESATPSVSPGSSMSNTASNTRSETVTPSVSPSATASASETASETASGSATASITASEVRSCRAHPTLPRGCRTRGGALLLASRTARTRAVARAQHGLGPATLPGPLPPCCPCAHRASRCFPPLGTHEVRTAA
jgi:hypothetical protein